jgi:hypothetical protein
MGRERKQMHLRQKAYFEQRLKDRLSFLAGKGVEPERAEKDPIARKLKADVKAVGYRLRKIAESEKIAADVARLKAERASPLDKEPEAPKAGKPKKASEGGKEKKPKAEKKPAPPKAPEGDQGSKAAEKPRETDKP